MLNWAKLGQLAKNGAVPAGGAGIVLLYSFGFTWWLIPFLLFFGFGVSLLTATPQKMLPSREEEEQLALQEAELDRQLQSM